MSKIWQLLLVVACLAACLLTDCRTDGFIVSSPSGSTNGGHRYQRPRKSFEASAADAMTPANGCSAARYAQLLAQFRSARAAYLSLLDELTGCTEALRFKLAPAGSPSATDMD